VAAEGAAAGEARGGGEGARGASGCCLPSCLVLCERDSGECGSKIDESPFRLALCRLCGVSRCAELQH